jgi:hypothetical protein
MTGWKSCWPRSRGGKNRASGRHPEPCYGVSASGIPHSFLTNVQNFQSEASLWVTTALMTGLFERHPKLKAAVFEASSTWLSFLLDECDKAYRLYRNERKLPPLKRLPSETFFAHCMTGFEGDERPRRVFPNSTATS